MPAFGSDQQRQLLHLKGQDARPRQELGSTEVPRPLQARRLGGPEYPLTLPVPEMAAPIRMVRGMLVKRPETRPTVKRLREGGVEVAVSGYS